MTTTNGTSLNTGASVDDVRQEIRRTRDDLGNTVAAVADKTDVKARAADAAHDVSESVRTKPGWWASIGAGVVAAGTAIGVLTWRRRRNTPKRRAMRAWHSMTARLHR